MMKKDSRFFSNSAVSLRIDLTAFTASVASGDSSIIDSIVAATKNGLLLDKKDGYAALKIALEKRDFKTAEKLIAAGAQTEIPYTHKTEKYDRDLDEWYSIDDTRYHSLFAKFGGDREIINFLRSNYLQIEDIEETRSNVSALPG
jgi:hypothetical protein